MLSHQGPSELRTCHRRRLSRPPRLSLCEDPRQSSDLPRPHTERAREVGEGNLSRSHRHSGSGPRRCQVGLRRLSTPASHSMPPRSPSDLRHSLPPWFRLLRRCRCFCQRVPVDLQSVLAQQRVSIVGLPERPRKTHVILPFCESWRTDVDSARG